jgi:hypothetical protein
VIRRLAIAIGRFLDALLPQPPRDDAADEQDAAGRVARLRLRLRLTEKQGHGGNR